MASISSASLILYRQCTYHLEVSRSACQPMAANIIGSVKTADTNGNGKQSDCFSVTLCFLVMHFSI